MKISDDILLDILRYRKSNPWASWADCSRYVKQTYNIDITGQAIYLRFFRKKALDIIIFLLSKCYKK